MSICCSSASGHGNVSTSLCMAAARRTPASRLLCRCNSTNVGGPGRYQGEVMHERLYRSTASGHGSSCSSLCMAAAPRPPPRSCGTV